MSGECSCGGTINLNGSPVPADAWRSAATEPLDAPFPVPAYPPREWFTERPDWLTTPRDALIAHLAAGGDPNEPPLLKLQVDDEGRVAGYFYEAGQCLVHNHGACPKPSPTHYAGFHQSHVACADGSLITCGIIGNVNGHANEYASASVAQAHYADPSRQLISCRAYDDDHGGFILGALVPETGDPRRPINYGDVALLRRSPLSGDWRPMPDEWWRGHGIQGSVVRACEGYDCIGPTLVTRPGLPLVRRFAAAVLGGMGGVMLDHEQEPVMETTIELPNGTKITTPVAAVPPGPHPDVARMAAGEALLAADAPPPAGGEPPAETQSEGDLAGRVQALEDAVGQLQDVVGQLIDAMSAPMAAAAELPPEDDDPKA